MRATVTSKGQVTIPKEIRDYAHISSGTELDFQIVSEGVISIRPLTRDIKKLKGIAKKKGRKPLSLKAMKQAIIDGAMESAK
ncbi:MAG: AbrB/MazE/SpoVT family DNA-binding domain-containing protein [Chlamydiales bacterium]|nr:AbrB/MazE/SpoVT family DNA-binding domain-containing protein [Chlamydiales bacterium]